MRSPVGVRFAICGVPFVTRGDPRWLPRWEQAWPRQGDERSAEIELEVRIEGALHPQRERRMPASSLLPDGGVELRGEDYRATVSADGGRVLLRQAPDPFGFETVIKMLVAQRLVLRGGLLVHGCAVAAEEWGALFTGQSGAGKSTLADLAEQDGLTVLADELVGVEPADGGYALVGTPWNRGVARRARCAALGTLGWAASHALSPSSAAELLKVLFVNAVVPVETAEVRKAMFRNAQELLAHVPAVRLDFALAQGVAEALADPLRLRRG